MSSGANWQKYHQCAIRENSCAFHAVFHAVIPRKKVLDDGGVPGRHECCGWHDDASFANKVWESHGLRLAHIISACPPNGLGNLTEIIRHTLGEVTLGSRYVE